MNIQQAYKSLGLTGSESLADINQAFQTKLSVIEEKSASAPTEALKQKFSALETDIKEAHQLLLKQENQQSQSNTPSPSRSASPLSQTKMADLPGMASTQSHQPSLEVGTVLANRYEIKGFIAQGGMGAVYRAFDKNRNEDIAIKVMLPQLMSDERAKGRFLDEARLSSQLSHPSIVNVFDVQQVDGLCFLTMELLEGQDLRQLIESKALVRQHFSLEEVIEILTPICAALDHAHELTVHRDIKPENIYLTDEGKYKLMDFGIARVMSTSQRTQTGAASGTAYYMAPEQLKGAKNIDGRADQYALAVLVYELLSGDVPAGAIEPLHELVKGISKKVSLSVQKALSPKPENRFDNISEFLNALQGTGNNSAMPSLPIKNIGIAAAVLIAILGLSMAATNGSLDNIWQVLKPVDKALIAEQKADIAKLQGEIKNYQKRLEKGQRNLNSEVRDAQRNNSGELKNLQYWQRLSDDYLFDGNELTDLEGELSKGENLLRQDTELTVQQASQVLTQVRDGYKALWAGFNAAEHLLAAEQGNNKSRKKWILYKTKHKLTENKEAKQAQLKEKQAVDFLRDANFVNAKPQWLLATKDWQQAYITAENLLAAKQKAIQAHNKWNKRKKAYVLENPSQVALAVQNENRAKAQQEEGDFIAAIANLQAAETQWQAAYQTVASEVANIDKKRAADKAAREKVARAKATKAAKAKAAKAAAKAKAKAKAAAAKAAKDAKDAKDARYVGKMVNIPAGSFSMGSNNGTKYEKSMHRVTVRAFKMGETEVTFAQWDACVSAGGCLHKPDDEGWGRGNRPVIDVNYNDINQQFIPWLNKVTGNSYRLPSESEWEYAARAGSSSKYSWGNSLSCLQARYGLNRWIPLCGAADKKTVNVKSYQANGFGLYDMHGNVWEWTQDCWNDSYHGAPANGKTWSQGDCSIRVLRGGSWSSVQNKLRSANRGRKSASTRHNSYGFRLVQGR